jgi:hypothetical protein
MSGIGRLDVASSVAIDGAPRDRSDKGDLLAFDAIYRWSLPVKDYWLPYFACQRFIFVFLPFVFDDASGKPSSQDPPYFSSAGRHIDCALMVRNHVGNKIFVSVAGVGLSLHPSHHPLVCTLEGLYRRRISFSRLPHIHVWHGRGLLSTRCTDHQAGALQLR